jgi:hypothetical protein
MNSPRSREPLTDVWRLGARAQVPAHESGLSPSALKARRCFRFRIYWDHERRVHDGRLYSGPIASVTMTSELARPWELVAMRRLPGVAQLSLQLPRTLSSSCPALHSARARRCLGSEVNRASIPWFAVSTTRLPLRSSTRRRLETASLACHRVVGTRLIPRCCVMRQARPSPGHLDPGSRSLPGCHARECTLRRSMQKRQRWCDLRCKTRGR